jgi:hypothetical protein
VIFLLINYVINMPRANVNSEKNRTKERIKCSMKFELKESLYNFGNFLKKLMDIH